MQIKTKTRTALRFAVNYLKHKAPKRTGNLAYNSIKYKIVDNAFVIYVDQKVAPYMPFTNEPWISPKWNGKHNPNEAWWDNAVEEIVKIIGIYLKGDIKNVSYGTVGKFSRKRIEHK